MGYFNSRLRDGQRLRARVMARSLVLFPLYPKGTFAMDDSEFSGVYAFDVLRYTAQFNCIQMSNGTSHADIPFLNGVVDEAAIIDAQNAGYTGVRIFYDQSGYSRNLVQTDFTKMPTVRFDITGNGKPSLYFAGDVSPQFLDAQSDDFKGIFKDGGGYISHTSRVRGGGSTAYGVLWSNYGDSFGYRTATTTRFTADFTTTDLYWTASHVNNTWYTWEFLYNPASPTSGQVYRDGVANGAQAQAAAGTYNTNTSGQLRIGSSTSGTAGIQMDLTSFIIAKDIP